MSRFIAILCLFAVLTSTYAQEVTLSSAGCMCLPWKGNTTGNTIVLTGCADPGGQKGKPWCYISSIQTCQENPESISSPAWDYCDVEEVDQGLWWRILGSAGCLTLSALFSGLTLGLLSLDKVGLEIVMASGSAEDAKNARIIAPIRENGNRLLCTLLLGNVAVNALLAIFLDSIAGGVFGFLISTVSIVIFGEILPQALCSRHSLYIGAKTAWIVVIFQYLFLPVNYPLAKVLDYVLGEELGTIYSRKELQKLVQLHAQGTGRGDLNSEEVRALEGALSFAHKTAEQIMTPMKDIIMIEQNQKLDLETRLSIFQCGHSRIPVYATERNNVIGLIFVKDLIMMSPEDAIPVNAVLAFYGRTLMKVWPDTTLDHLLAQFKTGKAHMAVVQKVNNTGDGDPFYENVGIVTMEDVVEEIIQDEIIDETDVYVDVEHRTRVDSVVRGRTHGFEKDAILAVFGKQRRGRLAPSEIVAVQSFLSQNVAAFSEAKIPSALSQRMLAQQSEVIEFDTLPKDDSDPLKSRLMLYRRGERAEHAILIITGRVEVYAGADGFRSELGPWTLPLLAWQCLEPSTDGEDFRTDFTAKICGVPCRLLCVRREHYLSALKIAELTRFRDSPSSNNLNNANFNRISQSPSYNSLEMDVTASHNTRKRGSVNF